LHSLKLNIGPNYKGQLCIISKHETFPPYRHLVLNVCKYQNTKCESERSVSATEWRSR